MTTRLVSDRASVSPRPGDLDDQGIAELRKVFPRAIARIEDAARVTERRLIVERVLDIIMSEPYWPRIGAVRRQRIREKVTGLNASELGR